LAKYDKKAPDLTFAQQHIYTCHKAPLTSRCCILCIYSTNTGTEYFKNAAHSIFFSSKCLLFHNATFFGSCIIHILHTGCAKFKKKSGAKGLIPDTSEFRAIFYGGK
jgi:hypothetical protein